MQCVSTSNGGPLFRDLQVWQFLNELCQRRLPNRSGHLAPRSLNRLRLMPTAVATAGRHVYDVRRHDEPLCHQAVVYGLALEDYRPDEVLRKIGVEPSGEAFNSITFD